MSTTDTKERTAPAGKLVTRLQAVLLAVTVLSDQISKQIVLATLEFRSGVEVIPGFFDFVHLMNRGGVWGMGKDLSEPARIAVFLALPTVVTCFALWYGRELPSEERLRRGAIALVVGGAIGNLIDRIRFSAVVDFFSFHVGEHYWPAFNIADSAICVGIGILVVTTILDRDEDAEDAEARVAGDG